jgi:hypothetical protein
MAHIWIPRLLPDLDGSPFLREPVKLALNATSGVVDRVAWEESRSRQQLAGLMAAVWIDICGSSLRFVANQLEYGGTEPERSARRAAHRGRELWSRLYVWPWALMPSYEADWWQREDIAEEWHMWRNPASWRHSFWVRR